MGASTWAEALPISNEVLIRFDNAVINGGIKDWCEPVSGSAALIR